MAAGVWKLFDWFKDNPDKASRLRYAINSNLVPKKKLLDKLIEIENAKSGQSRPGFDLAVQAGYRMKTVKARGKKNPSGSRTTTAPSGSFKNLLNPEIKVIIYFEEKDHKSLLID